MTTNPRRKRRTATPPPRLSDSDVIAMTAEYEELRAEEATAKKKADAIKAAILNEMKERGVEKIEWDQGRVTRTAAKTYNISIDVLREKLPTRLFNKVTTRVVDKTLLSAAVQGRTIDAAIVAEATTQGENAPYIRVSHGTGD